MPSPIKLEIEGKKYVAYPEQSEGEKKRSLRPEPGIDFHSITNTGKIYFHLDTNQEEIDQVFGCGNGFVKFEEAERELAYRQALQRVKEWIYEHDAEGEFKPNKYFRNFTIYFAIEEHKFRLESYNLVKKFSPFGYLKSEAACEQLIKEMDSDLRIIFNV